MRISDWSSDVCSSDLNEFPLDDRAYKRFIPSFHHRHGKGRRKQRAYFLVLFAIHGCHEQIVDGRTESVSIQAAVPILGIAQHFHDVLVPKDGINRPSGRSEEHTSELQSLMRISYAVFCLKKKKTQGSTNY